MATYPGGKQGAGVYQWLISQMPPHDTYVEPFVGGGAVLRLKRPAASSIAIDVDAEVISRWRGDEVRNLRVIHGDALEWLRGPGRRLNRRALVYCDPPYLLATRSSGRRIYQHEFGAPEEHEELLAALAQVPAMVMVSGYWSELYDGFLGALGWSASSCRTTTRGGKVAVEWVWRNFVEPMELHDYRYLGADYRERERIRKRQRRWKGKLERMPALERYAVLAALDEIRSTTAASGGEIPPPQTAVSDPRRSFVTPAPAMTAAVLLDGNGGGNRSASPDAAVQAPLAENVEAAAPVKAG